MEALVFILLIIFVVVNSGKKNKKAPAKPPAVPLGKQAEAIMEELRQTGRLKDAKTILDEPPADPAAKAVARHARKEAARKNRRPAPVPAPETAFAGFDAEGCVGGSMPHDHHEGEGRAEHARHLAAMTLREEQESHAARALQETSALTVRRLRQAVVMAEVLDRPVSMRRRGEGRVKS